ncbi:hypothetical protein PSEHALCIP103_01620 [Pseudoalteromonas haloplanktis]|uniref:Uncharacterized protein n=1 Tax=Pseudoalteromonas haloplanktis TaxID=228 RepID=A0A9W4QXN0_PSEHA|nr:hypothetical protein [Pseudoalteromonas haloplanktis]CAH9057258.1 hypothetical protein PSEHALCIP103_01620 [Pseudoalteromonas haloplanktis]
MTDFYVENKNCKIRTCRVIEGELEDIRFSGELWIDSTDFWEQFKRKVEYIENERLAFIIVSDDEVFDVDPSIFIADDFATEKSELNRLLSYIDVSSTLVKLYPNSFEIQKTAVNDKPEALAVLLDDSASEAPNTSIVYSSKGLQAHYRKKTNELKKEG